MTCYICIKDSFHAQIIKIDHALHGDITGVCGVQVHPSNVHYHMSMTNAVDASRVN